jgi:MazG family protein
MSAGAPTHAQTPGGSEDLSPVRRLLDVMAALRGEAGCPWDRRQTQRSLLPYLIEEAYELVEAVETGAEPAIREELGDVLLQVIFHARIAEEAGRFDFPALAGSLADKLIQRHPHVFGGAPLDSPEAVNHAWEARKMTGRQSFLEGIPSGLPALQWAAKVAGRAARAGFEWNHTGEIFAKAAEELEEFRQSVAHANRPAAPPPEDQAAASGTPGTTRTEGDAAHDGAAKAAAARNRAAAEMEFGDLIFALVQLGRWQGFDAEAALRRSTRKFIGRFQWMEEELRRRGTATGSLATAAWERLWQEAKAAEARTEEAGTQAGDGSG